MSGKTKISDYWHRFCNQSNTDANDMDAKDAFYAGACGVLMLLRGMQGLDADVIASRLNDLEYESIVYTDWVIKREDRKQAEKN